MGAEGWAVLLCYQTLLRHVMMATCVRAGHCKQVAISVGGGQVSSADVMLLITDVQNNSIQIYSKLLA